MKDERSAKLFMSEYLQNQPGTSRLPRSRWGRIALLLVVLLVVAAVVIVSLV